MTAASEAKAIMNPDKTLFPLPSPPTGAINVNVDLHTCVDSYLTYVLKNEALREKGTSTPLGPSAPKPRGQRKTRRKTRRIMREEYIDAMLWTRTFVSGPLDR